MKTVYAGINIQFPISRLILAGKKTIETRTYPIPPKYKGIDLLFIETPGESGDFKARIVGIISFDDSFKYPSKAAFYKDSKAHCVERNSPWAWRPEKGKWGWPILVVREFAKPLPLTKPTGIKYSTNIELDSDDFKFKRR